MHHDLQKLIQSIKTYVFTTPNPSHTYIVLPVPRPPSQHIRATAQQQILVTKLVSPFRFGESVDLSAPAPIERLTFLPGAIAIGDPCVPRSLGGGLVM